MASTNVVALYRIKDEEKLIERSIKSCFDLVDKIVILDDHSADRTEEICRSFGPKIEFVKSPFEETTDEVRDKNHLLNLADRYDAKWYLCLDADEELQPGGAARLSAAVDKMNVSPSPPTMVHFKFLYIWNSNMDIRVDGIYDRFISPRLWARNEVTKHYRFAYRSAKCGFHCGWVPEEVATPVRMMSRVHILHWGNHNEEIRRHKYIWYNLKDPNNFAEDRYRHIVGAGEGYKHAGREIQLYPLQAYLED